MWCSGVRPPSPHPVLDRRLKGCLLSRALEVLGRIQNIGTKCTTTNKEPGSYARNVYMYLCNQVNLLCYHEGVVAPLLYPFAI